MKNQSPIDNFWDRWRGWFTLGIGVKRWLVILAIGAVIAGTGISALLIAVRRWGPLWRDGYSLVTLQFLPTGLRIFLPLLVGFIIMLLAIYRLSSNLVAPFRRPDENVAVSLFRHSKRGRGPRIVAIGGGTGLPNLLRGLTEYTSNITAIITVADDGGSSGRLRRELGLIPPGDFRNNIAALARDEAFMTQLLQYRFGSRQSDQGENSEGGDLAGHAFGNLLLAALAGITGSFDEGLAAAGRVLAIRGRVLPSTLSNVILVAEVKVEGESGTKRVVGESLIPKSGGSIIQVYLDPAKPPAYPASVQAILQADLIVIGPGSLFTSILPNLLIPGILSALRKTSATKLFVCNLATQPGETDNYTVADHLVAINRHVSKDPSEDGFWIDTVLANSNLTIPSDKGGGNTQFVRPEGAIAVPIVTFDLVDEERPWRHDSGKLASAIAEIALQR
ncbi:MAG TPA: uridine diphosphate-N-acetylglucosamine-binding protein YvcK [candidate division Zixibacteria bacterium]|nr:uridine diphosphate-N-acetylglucosamine-binding protein YvcK [candidate division Zixibacteria bacterium]